MEPRTPRYLSFARTLALATTLVLPACVDSDPAPANEGNGRSDSADQSGHDDDTTTGATAGTTGAGGAGGAGSAGGAGGSIVVDPPADQDAGKISGPLPPPELPSSLA